MKRAALIVLLVGCGPQTIEKAVENLAAPLVGSDDALIIQCSLTSKQTTGACTVFLNDRSPVLFVCSYGAVSWTCDKIKPIFVKGAVSPAEVKK